MVETQDMRTRVTNLDIKKAGSVREREREEGRKKRTGIGVQLMHPFASPFCQTSCPRWLSLPRRIPARSPCQLLEWRNQLRKTPPCRPYSNPNFKKLNRALRQ